MSAIVSHPLARNFSFLAAGNLVSRALLLLVNIRLARVLTQENFGRILLAQTILLLATVAADLGIRTIAIRTLAPRPDADRPAYAAMTWGVALTLATFAIVLMGLGSLFSSDRLDAQLVLLFALALPAFGLNLDWLLKARQQFLHVGAAETLKGVTYLGLVLLWVREPGNVLAVPWANAVAWTAAAAYVAVVVRRGMGGVPAPLLRRQEGRTLVLTGLPVGINGILFQLHLNGGILFLGALASRSTVALYGSAFKLTLVVGLMGALFGEVLLPALARAFADSEDRGRRMVWRMLGALTLIGAAVAVVLGLFAHPLLTLIYGADYAVAAPTLRILALAIVPYMCTVPFQYTLIVKGGQRFFFISAAVGVGVNALVNVTLIPHYGSPGAAVAELVTEVAVASTLGLLALRVLGKRPPAQIPPLAADLI